MSQHTDVDVVIVGYGPVGQYLSYKLGRLGWTSACIERFPHAYAFPRAVHFDDEVARLFQSIGLDPENNPAIQQFDTPYRWVNADNEILLELDWRGTGRSGWHISNFFHQPAPRARDQRDRRHGAEGPGRSAAGRRSRSPRTTTAPPCWPAHSGPARTPRRGPSGAVTSSGPTARTPLCAAGWPSRRPTSDSSSTGSSSTCFRTSRWISMCGPGSGAGPNGRPRSSLAEPRTGSGGSSCGFPGRRSRSSTARRRRGAWSASSG